MTAVSSWKRRATSRVGKIVATLALTTSIVVGTSAIAAPSAEARTIRCGWPRCTVYDNREDTYEYAFWGESGNVPDNMVGYVWALSSLGARWFAIQYYNQGLCIGFNLSAVPWESQGLFGYRC